MWSPLYSSSEQSAFFLLFCLSMTRLLSECQMLYEWDYDGDKDTFPAYPFSWSSGSTDFPYETGDEHDLLFYYDGANNDKPRGMMMTEASSIPQSVQGRRRRPVTASAAATPNGGRLSPEKTWLLREHLNGLYALFKAHPALMDRRLRVGSRKPHIPPHHPDYTNLIKVSTSTAATTAGIKRLISSLYFQQPQPQPQLPALPTENDYGDGDYVPAAASPPPSPPRPPVIASPPHSSSSSSSPQAEKRSFTHLSSSVVCPAHTEWRLLHVARDINNTEVEVFQPRDGAEGHQWFYTTTCDHDHDHGHDYEHHNQHRHHSVRSPESGLEDCPDCCRGVNRHRYHSHCMTKTSFVMALVRKPRERQYNWNWIQVNSSCTCYISPV